MLVASDGSYTIGGTNVTSNAGDTSLVDIDSLYLDYMAVQADGKIVLAGGQNPSEGH